MPKRNQPGVIRLKKTKNGQIRVDHFGKNGEPLSNSETLTSYADALKNVVAHLRLYGGRAVAVENLTQPGPAQNILVRANGTLKILKS